MGRIRKAIVVVGVLALGLLATACEPPPSPWHAERVSGDAGIASGFILPDSLAVSADGTRVAFTSLNDAVGDGHGAGVFVRDLGGETITRATTTPGRFMRFSPDGTRLLALTWEEQGFNWEIDLVLSDLTSGTTITVADTLGTVPMHPPEHLLPDPAAEWSPDGTRIVFSGAATVPGGPTELDCRYYTSRTEFFLYNCIDVYVYDLDAATTALVSHDPDGTTAGSGNSYEASFSPDGAKVLYHSNADNQLPPTTPRGTIFLHDLTTGTRTPIDTTGTTWWALSEAPVMSPDGSQVMFTTTASDLGPTDTNGYLDVYLRDMATGTFRLVSANAAGTNNGNRNSRGLGFSPDGSQVLFRSGASDLGPVDSDINHDLYVRDLATGVTSLVTTNQDCTDSSTGEVLTGSFSPDGHSVLFSSDADDLGAIDENNAVDVYVHDLETCTNNLVSSRADGTRSGNTTSDQGMFLDAGHIAFVSQANDLVPDDTNWMTDVFVATLQGADLAITGSGDWNDGQQAYDLEVVNDGPDTAEAARVILRPPPGAELHSGSPGCVENVDEGVIECPLGDVAAGASVDVHLQLGIPDPPGSFRVAAIVDSTTFDYDTRNDVVTFVSG